MRNVMIVRVLVLGSLLFAAGRLVASDWDEFRVKREAVFGFAAKPEMTPNGDRVAIAFESKGWCDGKSGDEGRER